MLVSLSQAPSAVRAAANCYCQLLVSQSDNNVKLIVLDRLQELKNRQKDVLQVTGQGRMGGRLPPRGTAAELGSTDQDRKPDRSRQTGPFKVWVQPGQRGAPSCGQAAWRHTVPLCCAMPCWRCKPKPPWSGCGC